MTEPWVSRRVVDKKSTNPFSPTFGTAPPLLVGRDDTVRRVTTAVEVGPQHPDYTILITGPRGSGKTALLNAIESEAERASWPAISVSASTLGLCERITRSAIGILSQTVGALEGQISQRDCKACLTIIGSRRRIFTRPGCGRGFGRCWRRSTLRRSTRG